MDFNHPFGFSTKAIHCGYQPDLTGAVMPPIYLSSTFAQVSPGELFGKYEYARAGNPTRDILENNLAAIENGKIGIAFSSGCAAMSTVIQSLANNSHVILSDDVYGGTLRLFDQVYSKYGLSYTQCDLNDIDQVKASFQNNTQMIWLETPTNPLLKIIDIQALSKLKNRLSQEVILVVDNTFATPYLQNPLDLGADLVCHSTTKYLGGHSDLIGGALIVNRDDLAEKLCYLQKAIGAVPSPMDCYLLLRSIKTLAVRMKAHCENATIIAHYLNQHRNVKKVLYPGLVTHPQHHIARAQMRGFGGMISMVVKGTQSDCIAFLKRLKIFTLAESLGGVESLIEHPALMTHVGVPHLHRQKIGIEDTLVRISIGIEETDDLLKDLEQALDF